MTPGAAPPNGITTPRIAPGDRWISRAAAATVAALAGIAGAISYSHMRQLAQGHGQAGWHAHTFPLSVDGIEIVASLVLLADRRAGRRSGWLPWTALATGTAGSLAANIATAEPSMISRVIAGWPALALLIAVKLLSGILGHQAASHSVALSPLRDSDRDDDAVSRPTVPFASGRRDRDEGSGAAANQSCLPCVQATHGTDPSPDKALGTISGLDPGIADLLPAARAARDELHRDDQRLTRDGLAARLRQNGHPVRNSRLTPLLHALRSDAAAPFLDRTVAQRQSARS
jgi:hypothetical protein